MNSSHTPGRWANLLLTDEARRLVVDMLNIHAEALETSSGPYHEFLLMYKESMPVVYGFVEGIEDPSFYRGFIENILPDGWTVRLIRSRNRRAVLGILAAMPWGRFARSRICFFVDRDLSEYLDEEAIEADNLYGTDNYSIENDVVNGAAFERVIEEIFGIVEMTEEERRSILDQFNCNHQCFCEAMAPIMAQILVWRRDGTPASLANIKLSPLFVFNDGRLGTSGTYPSAMSRARYAPSA